MYCIGILECVSVHRHACDLEQSHYFCFNFGCHQMSLPLPPSLPPPTSMFFQVSIVKDPLCSLLYLYGLFHRCIVCFTMHYTCMLCFTIIPVWFVTLFHSYACMVCFTVIPVWFVSLLYLYGLLCRQSCCPIQNHGESGCSRCNGRGEALMHVCCRFCLC